MMAWACVLLSARSLFLLCTRPSTANRIPPTYRKSTPSTASAPEHQSRTALGHVFTCYDEICANHPEQENEAFVLSTTAHVQGDQETGDEEEGECQGEEELCGHEETCGAKSQVWFEPTDIRKASKPFHSELWRSLHFISPNFNELRVMAKAAGIYANASLSVEKNEGDQILEEASKLAVSLVKHIQVLIVTLGKLGVMVVRRGLADEPLLSSPTQMKSETTAIYARVYSVPHLHSVVSVSGAGDCLAAGIMAAMLSEVIEHPRLCIKYLAPVTVWSYLLRRWVWKIFKRGLKKELETEDLFVPLNEHKAWEEKLHKEKKPSLLRLLVRTYGPVYCFYNVFLAIMELVFRIAQPLFLGQLIRHFEPDSDVSEEAAYLNAVGLIVCSAVFIFVRQPYMMEVCHLGMKMRVAVCSLIYRKSLRLSHTALGETTVGQVVNLLSNDVSRLDYILIHLSYLILGPVQAVLVTYLMWNIIGISSVLGNLYNFDNPGYIGKKIASRRLRSAIRTDERVRLMNEIISGIQVIKMYTWEIPFSKVVAAARENEIHEIRITSYLRALMYSFQMFTTRLTLFFTLLMYVLLGNDITAEKACKHSLSLSIVFVVASFFNIMKLSMTDFFPRAIANGAEGIVSIKRIQNFLSYEELASLKDVREVSRKDVKDSVVMLSYKDNSDCEKPDTLKNGVPPGSGLGVTMSHVTAKWFSESVENTLTNINLTVKPGRLLAIIGPVGAGKVGHCSNPCGQTIPSFMKLRHTLMSSDRIKPRFREWAVVTSVLHIMLRELPLAGGSVTVQGKISYAAQEPWLFAGSVRNNILFGESYDRERYRDVVRVCALRRDFELLPHGDKSVVGERGISLSGGQRARINLASVLRAGVCELCHILLFRAVYKKADIYILDDPLSAVDAHVGKHLFEDCITGFLRRKTCILVTHQLQFLSHVDHIVILKHGSIEAEGTYTELQESGLDFAKLLGNQEGGESDNETMSAHDGSLRRRRSPRQRHSSLGEGCVCCELTGRLCFVVSSQPGCVCCELTERLCFVASSQEGCVCCELTGRLCSQSSSSSIDIVGSTTLPPEETKELRTRGKLNFSVYGAYFSAGGGCFAVFFMFFVAFLAQVLSSGTDYWLSFCHMGPTDRENRENLESKEMTDTESRRKTAMFNMTDTSPYNSTDSTLDNFTSWQSDNGTYATEYSSLLSEETCIYIFAALTLATVVAVIYRSLVFFTLCMKASINLHDTMFRCITRVPMRFFNINPSGQILNRFSNDMGAVDEKLPLILIECLEIGFALVGILTLVAFVNYWILLPTGIILVLFYVLRSVYITTSRSVKRLEGITRSPVFSHLNASLQGLATIRAFEAQKILEKEFDGHQDLHSSAFYLSIASNRAFGMWLDVVCLFFVTCVTLSFLVLGGVLIDRLNIVPENFGGDVGLAISQSIGLTGMFQWGMRQSAELENQMTSVERVREYSKLDSEPVLDSEPDQMLPPGCSYTSEPSYRRAAAQLSFCCSQRLVAVSPIITGKGVGREPALVDTQTKHQARLVYFDGNKPSKDWPTRGRIVFSNISLRYSKSDPPVLKNLNFTINPCEKIGIVGRTGAGKSSLISALFRLANTEGSIIIDNIDTAIIGLHDLRAKISIIPQEPVLFSGTLRNNLDPFEEYPDSVLWNSLEEVELKEAINELPAGLNHKVSEGGSNFSVGQRQLVCLARAIIRDNRILVMDEATANVDPGCSHCPAITVRRTDALIQKTVRRKFADCTVLTIAHRLLTVMDSDRTLVMDAGNVVELDHPYLLMENRNGFLYNMVQETGKSMAETLYKMAESVSFNFIELQKPISSERFVTKLRELGPVYVSQCTLRLYMRQ
uniref:Multidrug resistance-associated protein lethal(2)03659 n=1 Tax=Timema shepardi TaxID=629360 RepID=A0A7R9FYT7_TIMSH|nr:unnamed protein product [Timema shepardi]